MRYEELFKVTIAHNYFLDKGTNLWRFAPTLNCINKLKKYKLIFKPINNSFKIIYEYVNDDKSLRIPLDINENLRFLVYSNDEYLANYSNIPDKFCRQIFYLTDSTTIDQNTTRFESGDKNNALWGRFTPEEQKEISAKTPFALIELPCSALVNSSNPTQTSLAKEIIIVLTTKSIFWKYRVNTDRIGLSIASNVSGFAQSAIESENRISVFNSTSSIALREVPYQNISLMQNTTAILPNLPNPDVSNIYKAADGNYWADIDFVLS